MEGGIIRSPILTVSYRFKTGASLSLQKQLLDSKQPTPHCAECTVGGWTAKELKKHDDQRSTGSSMSMSHNHKGHWGVKNTATKGEIEGMPRKAKPTKHSSADLQKRASASLQNKGGGAAGLADRLGGAAGHSRFQCTICGVGAPSLRNMQASHLGDFSSCDHHNSRHDKIPWDPSLFEDVHAKHGGTTQGIAVRGTTNSKKLKLKVCVT
ncbi:unnamed protein product [Discosporangium mesarthrocarpum]